MAASCRFGTALASDLNWSSFEERVGKIDEASGGRLGVAILDTTTGAWAGHRSHERFPIVQHVQASCCWRGSCANRPGKRTAGTDCSLHTEGHRYLLSSYRETGRCWIKELCAAAITLSDNTAGNLLLDSLRGPTALNACARTLGDEATRLDRIEPDLNEALPGDPRDTTTPANILSDLREVVLGNALSAPSRSQLTEWLIHNKTGDARLRAGLPVG
jgi:beta-lactamase class A